MIHWERDLLRVPSLGEKMLVIYASSLEKWLQTDKNIPKIQIELRKEMQSALSIAQINPSQCTIAEYSSKGSKNPKTKTKSNRVPKSKASAGSKEDFSLSKKLV